MSHEHFKGKYEVELKYRLPDKQAFLEVLSSLDHEVMLENNLESDCYFDLPDQSLKHQNKSVCIREMQPSGILLWIMKGPEADRCEAVNISDAEKAKSILLTMGYSILFRMEKTRSIYFVGEYHLTLDHLDDVGDFAEFAIMTDDESKLKYYRRELVKLADQFGLSGSQLEYRSYRELCS